jgi:aminoglycoside phosphotransferase family enzyme/predicted kinase
MANDQRETIAFLSDGASYGRPGAPVERIETHASLVFLVGDRAFKLKRAVSFSYLDYSTVARREAACRTELTLNRRTAPSLYLAVRKIARQADGTPGFDGEGPALDWVVEMRRFPDDALFDRMAEAGRLTPVLMRALADEIAAFHAAAEPSRRHGGAAAVASLIAGNDENLRLAGDTLDQGAVAALKEASEAALRRVSAQLDRRREEGHVRRCHGDLHLGNICLVDGRPTLFDAIEFNDAISTIDTVYDLAFLLMDLSHRGLDALANLVFNRYLDRTGEDAALPALPLFLSLRAAIRAHVTTAALRQKQDRATAERLGANARHYLDLARRLLQPAAPRLVVVGGFSGTGKSTLALALAADFAPAPGARHLRSDVLRKVLLGAAPETRLPPEAYDAATTDRVYRALGERAATALAAGYSAVVDAVFLKPSERAAIGEVARAAGVPFTGLWLEAPAAVLAQRVAARRGDASDADVAVLERQLSLDPGPLDWQRVDASGNAAEALTAARRLL